MVSWLFWEFVPYGIFAFLIYASIYMITMVVEWLLTK